MISFEILHLLVADHHFDVRNVCLDCLKVSVRFGKHLTFPERVADCFVARVKFRRFGCSFDFVTRSFILIYKIKFMNPYLFYKIK
jgi:hypothetical protein